MCKAAILLVASFLASGAPSAMAQPALEQELARVEELLQRGDLKNAEAQLRQLARLHPTSYIVRNNLGALYMQQRRYPEACREFTAAVNLDAQIADVQRNLGACRFLSGAFERAIGPLRRAKALDGDDPRTRYQLGYALLMLNRPREAQPELEYVRSKMPEEERTLFALVKLYQAEGNQDRAAEAFAKLQGAHPDSPFVHVLLGESYDIQEKADAAAAEFRKAIELAPSMPRLHFDLGFLYWEVERFAEASTELHKEIQINPAFAPAYHYLGEIALTQDRPTEAAEFFKEAISRGPGCLGAYLGLGKAYMRTDKVSDAAKQFEQANRLDGSQADVHYWLATTYRRLGDATRSEAEMRQFQNLRESAKRTPAAKTSGFERWANPACLSGLSSGF